MGYPRHKEFSLEEKELQVAVCWLEEQKIRLYPHGGEEREELRKFEKDWCVCFKKYLKDLKSPDFFVGEGGEGEGVGQAFEWLSSYALQLDYSDLKEKYHGETAKVVDLQANVREENEMEGIMKVITNRQYLLLSYRICLVITHNMYDNKRYV